LRTSSPIQQPSPRFGGLPPRARRPTALSALSCARHGRRPSRVTFVSAHRSVRTFLPSMNSLKSRTQKPRSIRSAKAICGTQVISCSAPDCFSTNSNDATLSDLGI
jgi:hypothetical protein